MSSSAFPDSKLEIYKQHQQQQQQLESSTIHDSRQFLHVKKFYRTCLQHRLIFTKRSRLLFFIIILLLFLFSTSDILIQYDSLFLQRDYRRRIASQRTTKEDLAYPEDTLSTDLYQYQNQINAFYHQFLSHQSSELPDWTSFHQSGFSFSKKLTPTSTGDARIPHLIHQTGPSNLTDLSSNTRDAIETWRSWNPTYTHAYLADHLFKSWFIEHFGSNEKMVDLWNTLGDLSFVMQADLWRYLRLIKLGGVYSDLDTSCLKPIDTWADTPSGQSMDGVKIIVGIEVDVGDRTDWDKWWPRPIQIVQWTIASTPNHPVLIDTIRRIHSTISSHSELLTHVDHHHLHSTTTGTSNTGSSVNDSKILGKAMSASRIMKIVSTTGPAVFTDSVIKYLSILSNGHLGWRDLKNLGAKLQETGGIMKVGDLAILPITGFSPGIESMGSGDIDDPMACVHHQFAGTWKLKVVDAEEEEEVDL